MITKTSIMTDVITRVKYFVRSEEKWCFVHNRSETVVYDPGDNSFVLGLVCGLLYTSASPSVVSIIVLNVNGRGIAGTNGSCSLPECK